MANIANNRLTIQIDLSGFSFKITDPSGGILERGSRSFPSEVSVSSDIEEFLKKELSSISLLSKKYDEISVFVDTPVYTLVPTPYYIKEKEKEILSQMHKVEEMDEIMSTELPSFDATLIYAIPNSITSRIFKIQKRAKYYPTIYDMIQRLPQLQDNNKVLIHFSKGHVHIVAGEGQRLLLANSYKADDFTSAQYYLFLVIKEVMFNPEFTTLQVMGEIDRSRMKSLSKYFKGVKICE